MTDANIQNQVTQPEQTVPAAQVSPQTAADSPHATNDFGHNPAISYPTVVSADFRFPIQSDLSSDGGLNPKRIVDLVLTSILTVIFLPVFLCVGIVLLLTGGNFLFHQERIGRNGVSFSCLKFRTMTTNADQELEELLERCPESRQEWAASQKLRDDPRITAFGKFLRSTSLDEIPQFLNVLRGDMSLVGPRPIVADEVKKYRRYFKEYASVRPGISGLWQVSGRNNVSYRRRVALDTFYARNHSLRLDLSILLRTFGAVIRRFGAY